jgi:hypothetical protein
VTPHALRAFISELEMEGCALGLADGTATPCFLRQFMRSFLLSPFGRPCPSGRVAAEEAEGDGADAVLLLELPQPQSTVPARSAAARQPSGRGRPLVLLRTLDKRFLLSLTTGRAAAGRRRFSQQAPVARHDLVDPAELSTRLGQSGGSVGARREFLWLFLAVR